MCTDAFCNVLIQELTNSRYQIVSPEFYFLYIQDYCFLCRMLFSMLYQKSWQNSCIWAADQCVEWQRNELTYGLAIKSMFSTSCVCNLCSLKIYLFFLNKQWYKLWLNIAITRFRNIRFMPKIISALYIRNIKAGKVYKLKNCFVATTTRNRSSPSFLSVVSSLSSTETSVA